MTIPELHEIVATSGLRHAEFCVDQEVSHAGSAAVAPLYAEISRLASIEIARMSMELDSLGYIDAFDL